MTLAIALKKLGDPSHIPVRSRNRAGDLLPKGEESVAPADQV